MCNIAGTVILWVWQILLSVQTLSIQKTEIVCSNHCVPICIRFWRGNHFRMSTIRMETKKMLKRNVLIIRKHIFKIDFLHTFLLQTSIITTYDVTFVCMMVILHVYIIYNETNSNFIILFALCGALKTYVFFIRFCF